MENTKEQIVEALDEKGIKDIGEATDYLNTIGCEVTEITHKWGVFDDNSDFKFETDEEFIKWAREQRDEIEVAENE